MATEASGWARWGLPAGVLLVALALVAVTWAAVGQASRAEQAQTLAAAEQRTSNLAIAFEQYVSRTIENADALILAISYEYRRQGGPFDLEAFVEDLQVDLSAYEALSIVDADGSVIPLASVPPIPSPINIADRPHFAVHREQEIGRAFVGPPVHSRRSGRDIVPVTRRLNGPDGRFAGIISVQFDPARFTAFYGEATLGARDVISLVGRDGLTRARRVGDRSSAGQDVSSAQLMREWAERPAGTYVGPGGLDGVTRLFSYRTVGAYPLVATIGESVDDLLADVRARAAAYRRAGILVTVVILLSSALLVVAIDRRRSVYQQLAASHSRFKGIFDHASDAMLLADDRGTYIDANPGACALVGYPRSELVGLSARDLIVVETGADVGSAWAAFLAHGAMSGEVRLRRKDGSLIDAEFRAVANVEPGVHLSVLRDVTERRRMDQQALRKQRMESLGTLAGGVAHDLNNALTPILLSTEVLRDGEVDAWRLTLLAGIEESARRGAAMARQILAFAQGVEGERGDVPVADLVHRVVRIANDTFLKQVRAAADMPEDPGSVVGDATQLQQALLNLCMNARDALPSGGRVTVAAARTTVDAAEAARHLDAAPGLYVRITVVDNGTGIARDIADRVFDPFFTTRNLAEASGLGLTTTLAIVRSHGGFMHIESEPGRGTRVHVCLPAC